MHTNAHKHTHLHNINYFKQMEDKRVEESTPCAQMTTKITNALVWDRNARSQLAHKEVSHHDMIVATDFGTR